MADRYHDEWMRAFHSKGAATTADAEKSALGFARGRFDALRGRVAGHWAAGNYVESVGAAIKGGVAYPFQKTGDFLKGGAKGTVRAVTNAPGAGIAKWAALGGAAIAGLAILSNVGKKKVEPADASPDAGDNIATANFDMPAPQMTSESPTMMGLQPVEGEHVSRLGKSGQQRFTEQVVPIAARDAGFEDVATIPQR